MAAITRDSAVKQISEEVDRFSRDDLVEVYGELFPDSPGVDGMGEVALVDAINRQIQSGLEVEEIVDLWNVVFPKDRDVWFDDETDTLRFNGALQHAE